MATTQVLAPPTPVLKVKFRIGYALSGLATLFLLLTA